MVKLHKTFLGISRAYNLWRLLKFLLITSFVSSLLACGGSGSSSSSTNNNNNNNNNTISSLVSIEIQPSNSTLALKSIQQYKAVGKYSDGTTNDITNQVNWSVSNSAIATINTSGTLTAVSVGSTFVYAKDSTTGIQESAALNVIHSLQVGAPNGTAAAADMTSDSLGNKYVVGTTSVGLSGESQNGGNDYFIAKYDANGNLTWSRQVGADGGYTAANGVSVDSSNNIYVVGRTDVGLSGEIQNGYNDYFIAKYDTNGNLSWSRQVGGNDAGANGISVDSSNNVYVSGYTNRGLSGESQNGGFDYFIAKYDVNGDLEWSRQVGSPNGDTSGSKVSTDSSGHIYVTGGTDKDISGEGQQGVYDYFIARYEPDGSLAWTKQGGASGGNTGGNDISADNSGKIYVVGTTNVSLTGKSTLYSHNDYFLATYKSDGTLLRTIQVGDTNRSSTQDVYGSAVKTDNMGNVYVGGSTSIDLTGNNEQHGWWDAFIAKYDANGNLSWTKQIGASDGTTEGFGLTLSNSNIYITGFTDRGLFNQTQNGNQDYFIWGVSN